MNNFDFVRPSTAALYTFDDENCLDSSPNGNDLTLGSPAYDLGKFGQAVYFSGSTFKRTNKYFSSLALTTFSILCWIKTISSASQFIFSFEDSYSTWLTGYSVGTLNGNVFLSTADGSFHQPQFVGALEPNDGLWHWIAITRGSTYSRIYVDGELDLQAANDGLSFPYEMEIACMGAYWDQELVSAKDKFNGHIDNLHILSSELLHAAIRKMYAFQMGWL